MSDPELVRFAEALIRLVRDEAIEDTDRLIAGRTHGARGERWRDLATANDTRNALHALVPDVVDSTLFRLLDKIDNDQLPLAWKNSDGELVPLSELGMRETAGWLMGSPGWRHAYSRQRFADDVGTLRLAEDDARVGE